MLRRAARHFATATVAVATLLLQSLRNYCVGSPKVWLHAAFWSRIEAKPIVPQNPVLGVVTDPDR